MLHAMTSSTTSLFHLAFHVRDPDVARRFTARYRVAPKGAAPPPGWTDLHGHQLAAPGELFATTPHRPRGDHLVPMPHFGLILELPAWRRWPTGSQPPGGVCAAAPAAVCGQPGEQWTMFFSTLRQTRLRSKAFASLAGVFQS